MIDDSGSGNNNESDNHTNDITEIEDCNTFDCNKESGLLRCKNCNNAVFTIRKCNVVKAGTTSSLYTEVGSCCECYAYTIVSDLRERYNSDDLNSGNDSIISVQFKESQIIALDNCLDLLRKQFSSIVADKTNTISDEERRKFSSKLTQVDQLMKMIKSTAHD